MLLVGARLEKGPGPATQVTARRRFELANLSPTEVTRARASCRPRVKLPSAICQLPASARPLYGFITLDFRGSRQRSVREGNDPKYIHFAFWTIHTRCSHTISRDHFYKNKNRQSHETPSSLQTAEYMRPVRSVP